DLEAASIVQIGICGTTCGSINPLETCDDGNPCTDDSCGAESRCQHVLRPNCTPISGTRLKIRDSDSQRRQVTFISNGDLGDTTAINPVFDGAYVQLYNPDTSESACLSLPNIGGAWQTKVKGNNITYKYRDKAFANGPCSSASIARKKIAV